MSVANIRPNRGTLDGSPLPESKNFDVQIINGLAHRIHKVMVFEFTLSDVEDPELYAAEPLYNWQQSEHGQWVLAHAIETPVWHRIIDPVIMGYRYGITAKLRGRDYTFWVMKWGSAKSK